MATTDVASPPAARRRGEEPEAFVWLTVALALLLGWLVQGSVVNRTKTAEVGQSAVTYPASWSPVDEKDATFAAADLFGGGGYGARVSLYQVPKTTLLPGQQQGGQQQGGLVEAATQWSIQRGRDVSGYRVLGIRPVRLKGREAVNIDVAYVANPPQGAAPNAMPGLMHAVHTLVPAGDQFYVLAFATESHEFARRTALHEKLLDSWRLP